MKKWMYICAAVFMIAGTLSGCSGKNSSESGHSGSEAAQETMTGADGTTAPESPKDDGKNDGDKAVQETAAETSGAEEAPQELASGRHHVVINMENYDPITVEIYADEAPITATNFLKLAQEGFYDGLTFHRIISGFMIQGGDPLGNGTGGSDQTIKGEFASNGVDNPLSHTRGAVSMARSQFPDSASSQFFIVHEDSTYLDGEYAVFGYVTEGMETVDAICEDTPVEDGNGTVLPENQPVIESMEVID